MGTLRANDHAVLKSTEVIGKDIVSNFMFIMKHIIRLKKNIIEGDVPGTSKGDLR